MPNDPRQIDRRQNHRRREDDVRQWLPLILSLVATLVTLVLAWGRVGGRLDLIEYRLLKIEESIRGKVILP